MRKSFRDEENPVGSQDVLWKLVGVLLVLLFAEWLQIKAITEAQTNLQKKAEFAITSEWNKDLDCDVDLWVRDPLDNIVSFQSRENGLMNLERDDLGHTNDSVTLGDGKVIKNPENKEYVFIRGIVPGEYTVNIHLYNCMPDMFVNTGESKIKKGTPLINPFEVIVKLDKMNPQLKSITQEKIILSSYFQEKTAFEFSLDMLGNVIKTDKYPRPFMKVSISNDSGFP